MNAKNQKPELLAPVRDETSFTAALQAGADAVYFGLGLLNMRVNSRGIEPDKLPGMVRQAHDQNTKVYITVNSIVFDQEMNTLDSLLDTIQQAGADAVICWDPAVILKAREKGLTIHISTQASISNSRAAQFYQNLGARRIVPARELNLQQLQQLKTQTALEVEVFIHGAMCVSISGRCFMSQFLHGRSANRGDCLQPCRYAWTVTDPDTGSQLELGNDYVMSPQDLCALPVLDKLVAAGIDSFKIEGRSRPPEYIRTVTSVYRRAIDAIDAGSFDETLVKTLMGELGQVYNRGFSTGFLLGRPGPQDWSDRKGSWSTWRKIYVGKIINHYTNINVASVQVTSHPLQTGDKIQIHGPTTGIIDLDVTELRDDAGRPIAAIDKGIASFPCSQPVRHNDQLFVLKDDGNSDD